MVPVAHVSAVDQPAFRIAPNDSNYFVPLFTPQHDGITPVLVVEIFTPGGRTPPNQHPTAHEFFFVLAGQGVAHCAGLSRPIVQGDALMLRPGHEHVIENTGPGKLYTLTMMVPDEDFAALILGGSPVDLDDQDRQVLRGVRS